MINICIQSAINIPDDKLWQELTKEIPPEQREVGAIMSGELVSTGDTAPPKWLNAKVLRWNEGYGFTLRVEHRPYLRKLIVDVTLERNGWERTIVTSSITADIRFGLLVRLFYRLFRSKVHQIIVMAIARERHELETGEKVTEENRGTIRLDEIEFVECSGNLAEHYSV